MENGDIKTIFEMFLITKIVATAFSASLTAFLWLGFENFYGAFYIFFCHLPSKKKIEYLPLVLRAHYAICRFMFTVGFQDNFGQMTGRFSAGRR